LLSAGRSERLAKAAGGAGLKAQILAALPMVATRKRARVPGHLDDSPLASISTSRVPLELVGGHAQPARMVEYFRQGKLTDVTILVDGRSYAAHRNVLAAASDYLDRLFAGPAWADQEEPVRLSQVPGAHTFAQILEYIYTGKCMTHEGDLISMLEAAHYLQIDPLLRALQDLVSRRVDSSNCLEAWSVADRYSLDKLSATAMQMALRSFEQVAASPSFLSMPIAFVRALILDDKLIAREEEPVFEAVVRWLHGQEETTCEEQQALLTLVRYPNLPHSYVMSRVQREPLILRHPMGLGLLLESYQQRVYALPDSRLHRRRLGQIPHGVQRPVPAELLIGWEKHFEVPYSQRTQPSDLSSVPERATHIFVGARAPGGHIALGAMASRDTVLRLV